MDEYEEIMMGFNNLPTISYLDQGIEEFLTRNMKSVKDFEEELMENMRELKKQNEERKRRIEKLTGETENLKNELSNRENILENLKLEVSAQEIVLENLKSSERESGVPFQSLKLIRTLDDEEQVDKDISLYKNDEDIARMSFMEKVEAIEKFSEEVIRKEKAKVEEEGRMKKRRDSILWKLALYKKYLGMRVELIYPEKGDVLSKCEGDKIFLYNFNGDFKSSDGYRKRGKENLGNKTLIETPCWVKVLTKDFIKWKFVDISHCDDCEDLLDLKFYLAETDDIATFLAKTRKLLMKADFINS